MVVLLACKLFCDEVHEQISKSLSTKAKPVIHNELFKDIPEKEIPLILKQANEIVEKIQWKAKYGTNLLGTVSVNQIPATSQARERFVDTHLHSSPKKTKRSWHFDLQDPSPKP